jgi:ribonuclease PH
LLSALTYLLLANVVVLSANLNNAKQAAITAINGASDLNQHQKDTLKAQANGAQLALFKFCVPFNACFALLTLLSACSTAVFAVFGPVCLCISCRNHFK